MSWSKISYIYFSLESETAHNLHSILIHINEAALWIEANWLINRQSVVGETLVVEIGPYLDGAAEIRRNAIAINANIVVAQTPNTMKNASL